MNIFLSIIMNSIMQCPADNNDTPINYYTVQILDESGVLCHREQKVGADECRRKKYMTLRSCLSNRMLKMEINAINDAGKSQPAVVGKPYFGCISLPRCAHAPKAYGIVGLCVCICVSVCL